MTRELWRHPPETEVGARERLAACYRVIAALGWDELIFNHISLRLPGERPSFLINPYGLHYDEVRASNLVKVGLDGEVLDDNGHSFNPAGFTIHSAIHAALPRAHAIFHTHTTPGMAVACARKGLTPTNFYAALVYDNLAYHDFEGITTRLDERERLVASLGQRNCLILRNHGLLTWGEDLAQAFAYLWTLQRACEVQVATPGEAIEVSREVRLRSVEAAVFHTPARHAQLESLVRRLPDASWKD
jgi:ribulose-5-phosphate 4-epimerase/fuculose-1-phosphate aldolase